METPPPAIEIARGAVRKFINASNEVYSGVKRAKFQLNKGFRVGIGNKRSQAAEMVINPGETEGGPHNHHRGADQWLYVVSGSGVAIVDRKRIDLSPKSLLLIERGENHEIRNTGSTKLRTINFYVPPAYTKTGNALPAGRP